MVRASHGRKTDIGRPIAHQHQHADQRDGEEGNNQAQGDPPPPRLGGRGDHRQKDELPGGVGRGEQADDQAAPADEPAGRHRCAEHLRRHARAEADDKPPEQHQLPEFGHGDRKSEAGDDQEKGSDDHPADTKAVHQRCREGPHQAEQDQADGEGGGNIGVLPAELGLERPQHDARCSEGPCRCQHGDEGDGGDHPAVVNVATGKEGREGGRRHRRAFVKRSDGGLKERRKSQ